MDNNIFVTIVVPVYNVDLYVRQCLDSLVNQTYKFIEVVCVNDASPDESEAIIEKFISSDSRVRVVTHKVNKGLAEARNTGIENAKGDYLFFVDADDYLLPSAIEELIMASRGEADVVLAGFKSFSGNSLLEARCKKYNNYYNRHLSKFSVLNQIDFNDVIVRRLVPATACKLYKMSFLKEHSIRFINQNVYHEDEGWLLKWLACEPRVVAVNSPLYCRRVEEASIMGQVHTGDSTQLEKSSLGKELVLQDALKFISSKNRAHYNFLVMEAPLKIKDYKEREEREQREEKQRRKEIERIQRKRRRLIRRSIIILCVVFGGIFYYLFSS